MQKYRCNAEPLSSNEEQNNESVKSVFDTLLDPNHEESDKEDPVAAALAAAVAPPTPKPAKKKIVRASFKISDLENIICTARGGEYLVQMIVDCADNAIKNLKTSSSKNYARFSV